MLKHMLRKAGLSVTYVEAHGEAKHEAWACFDSERDVDKAVRHFDGHDINGRRMKVTADGRHSPRHSRSRSPSRGSRRSPGHRRADSVSSAGSKGSRPTINK